MKLDERQILNQSHIPTDEIERDIADTQREVDQYEAELKPCLNNRQENKVRIYMLEGKIRSREDFIETLECILNYRKVKESQ